MRESISVILGVEIIATFVSLTLLRQHAKIAVDPLKYGPGE